MERAATIKVPFVSLGNCRALTDEQLAADPCLADFVRRFPTSFKRDHNRALAVFVEPD